MIPFSARDAVSWTGGTLARGDAATRFTGVSTDTRADVAGKLFVALVGARHDAHAFVYVVEGSIVMQVKGKEEVTLTEGQTFYEAPDDVHLVGRNASDTKPAKFVVFLVKDKDAPILVPERPEEDRK